MQTSIINTPTSRSTFSFKMDLPAIATILLAAATVVDGFSSPVFQKTHHLRKQMPSKTEGVEIELPNFDELFGRIRAVSPLADKIMSGDHSGRGLQEIDDTRKLLCSFRLSLISARSRSPQTTCISDR